MKNRIEQVLERIRQAATACNRPETDIRLVAVSKTMPVEDVKEAIEAGMTDFGENFILFSFVDYREFGPCPRSNINNITCNND